MRQTYNLGLPREKAIAYFKELVGGMTDSERFINQGYGLQIKGKYEAEPFSIVLYFNKKDKDTKLVLEKGESLKLFLNQELIKEVPRKKEAVNGTCAQTHIGTDESGKGDLFGPLVIAGFLMKPTDQVKLRELGVADSKVISDLRLKKIAAELRSSFPQRYNLVVLNPEKYNQLYAQIKNLNKLLAWGHARVIENILLKEGVSLAVVDQFGNEKLVEQALLQRGRKITIKQRPRAEEDLAVAAASILARDLFLTKLAELSQNYELTLPKGCNQQVKVAGKQFITKYGIAELGQIAKLHFKTADEICQER